MGRQRWALALLLVVGAGLGVAIAGPPDRSEDPPLRIRAETTTTSSSTTTTRPPPETSTTVTTRSSVRRRQLGPRPFLSIAGATIDDTGTTASPTARGSSPTFSDQ